MIVGAVYTPFLRVAFAARAAQQAGHAFSASDVPPALVEPVAYIAVRWYCCDRDHGNDVMNFDPLVPFDYKIAVPGRDQFPSKLNLVAPLWVSRDLSVLAGFGAELPYRDIVLVATYPMSALIKDTDIVIYRDSSAEDHAGRVQRELRYGRITAEDLAHWR